MELVLDDKLKLTSVYLLLVVGSLLSSKIESEGKRRHTLIGGTSKTVMIGIIFAFPLVHLI